MTCVCIQPPDTPFTAAPATSWERLAENTETTYFMLRKKRNKKKSQRTKIMNETKERKKRKKRVSAPKTRMLILFSSEHWPFFQAAVSCCNLRIKIKPFPS